jgi:phage-related minor tail protein
MRIIEYMSEGVRSKILNILGISMPSGTFIASITEIINPLLQCGLIIVSLGVGITAIIMNIQKIKFFRNTK